MLSLFKPPSPVPIFAGGGNGGGNAISNTSSSVVAISDEEIGSSVEIRTNNEVAVIVDNSQNVIIGSSTSQSSKRLTVSAPFGQCIQLINETTNTNANLIANADGGLTFATSGSNVQFGSNKVHVGAGSLYIGSVAVTSNATQLNSVDTTPGIAVPLKALVVDSNRNIQNINSLAATSLTGTILTAAQPNINSLNSVNILSLSLSGFPVLSTATDLNYLRGVVAGTVRADRALVVDGNKNINGLNSLQATALTGVIQTSSQPNITSIGALSSLAVNGFIGIGTITPTRPLDITSSNPIIRLSTSSDNVELSIDPNGNFKLSPSRDIVISSHKNLIFSGSSSITGLQSLLASTLTGTIQTSAQPVITSVGILSRLNVDGDVYLGLSNTVSNSSRLAVKEPNGECLRLVRTPTLGCSMTVNSYGDLELNPTRDVKLPSGKAIRMAGPISGISDLSASTITGTIQTAAQPNITSIGILTSLTVTNDISTTSLSASLLTGTIQTAAQPNITTIGTLASLSVTNSILCSTLSATTLSGTLQTAAQPNITSVGTLSSLAVTNSISCSNLTASTLAGTIQTASQPNITSIGTLSSLTVANTISCSDLTSSTLAGTLQTAAQPNITSVGTLSSLAVTNSISCSNLTASTLVGTIQTASQPNITSIGTLSSLSVINGISASIVDASLLTGVIQTANQPNITTIGTLKSIQTTGPISIGGVNSTCAIDINTSNLTIDSMIRLSNGVINASISLSEYGLDLNTNGQYISLGVDVGLRFTGGTMFGLSSLSATEIAGTLQTAAQPNITSVGTLSYLDSDFIGLGTEHSNQYRLNMFDDTGKMIMMSNGSQSFILSIVNGDYALNTSNNRLALGPDVDLVLNGGTIIGLDDLSVNTLSGVLQTSNQPNITSIGTLNSLSVNGGISANSATLGSARVSGDLVVDGQLRLSTPLSFSNLASTTGVFGAGIGAVSATNGGTLTVTGGAAFSQNVIIGTSLTVGGVTVNRDSLSALSGGTPGIVTPNVYLSADSSHNLTGFNSLTATQLRGTIQTASQPLITTVGNLLNLNVNGYLGVGTSSPMKQLEINSDTGDCLRLSNNKATRTAFMDVSVDSLGNASFTPNGESVRMNSRMITPQIVLGNSTNTIMPLEIGFSPFVMTQPYAFNSAANGRGMITPPTINPPCYNYSIRALGRILCTQSLDVMSDKRTKKNIAELTDDYCTAFVEQTTPVNFNWIDGDENKSFGYIAQELLRCGFHELVNLVRDDNVKEVIDDDGFMSPAGVKFTVTYDYIIPILAKNQKRLMRENAELKDKLDKILDMLQHH